MVKDLKLFKYVDGANDVPFPDVENQIVISAYEFNASRMTGVPRISARIMYPSLISESEWGNGVYTEFRGERYFITKKPSSKKNNSDLRYEYDIELLSERNVLDNVIFLDVVRAVNDSCFSTGKWNENRFFWFHDRWASGTGSVLSINDTAVSNSANVQFFGNVRELCERINASMSNSLINYKIIIDDGVSSEEKLVTFDNSYISEAIQGIYNIFGIEYYFDGKIIHVGEPQNAIEHIFEYGKDNALLSISKSNRNNKIINRITGTGSKDNIPYYYPNESPKGKLGISASSPSGNLLPSDVKIEDYETFSDNVTAGVGIVYNQTAPKNPSEVLYHIDDDFLIEYKRQNKDGIQFDLRTDSKRKDITFLFKSESRHAENIKFSLKLMDYDNELIPKNYFLSAKIKFTSGEEYDGFMESNNVLAFYGSGVGNFDVTVKIGITYLGSLHHSIKLYPTPVDDYYWEYKGKKIELKDIGLSISKAPQPGDTISQTVGEYITPSENLMPPIYRESAGAERFYIAKNSHQENEPIYKDDSGKYIVFENEFSRFNPKEGVTKFEDIKPTIEGKDYGGLRIDMFEEFAYDENDSSDFDKKTNKYKHPYFFGKLRPLGFNLFSMSNEKRQMSVSMKSGDCGACEFNIEVGKETGENLVQLNDDGSLKRYTDGEYKGDVICGNEDRGEKVKGQKEQQDTTNRSVWVALKKDNHTYDKQELMPNKNLKPRDVKTFGEEGADRFVILGMTMPQFLIEEAEEKLGKELIRFMKENNEDKFDFSIKLSRVFLKEHEDIRNTLNENSTINLRYNGQLYVMHVESYKYKVSNNEILPNIEVTVKEEVSIYKNSIEKKMEQIREDIFSSISKIDIINAASTFFLKRDVDDTTNGLLRFLKGIEVGNNKGLASVRIDDLGKIFANSIESNDYASGIFGNGFRLGKNATGTMSRLEVDELFVRVKAFFSELQILTIKYAGGNWMFSPAGMECTDVVEVSDGYLCYFNDENKGEGSTEESGRNYFDVGDLVMSRDFKAKTGTSQNVQNRYYWIKCIETGKNYIKLSKADVDKDPNSNATPKAGDSLVTFGNSDPFKVERQNAILISTTGPNAPSIEQFAGVNSFEYKSKRKTVISPNGNEFTGSFTFTSTGKDVEETINNGIQGLDQKITSSNEKIGQITKDLEVLQKQNDGAIEFWFGSETPTLTNKPASDWLDEKDETQPSKTTKEDHLADMYYYTKDGVDKAYRFSKREDGSYYWNEVVDSGAKEALEAASKAQATADGKMTVYTEQPTNKMYRVGDLWVNANFKNAEVNYVDELLRCNHTKLESESFSIKHWGKSSNYTDDKAAKEASAAAEEADRKAAEADKKAKAANDLLADIASDNKFTPSEKQQTKKEWEAIKEEKPKNVSLANDYGVPFGVYEEKYDALEVYIVPFLANMSETSDITGPNFRSKFNDYYIARTQLLNNISLKAKAIADNAQSDATKAINDLEKAQKDLAEAKQVADDATKRLNDWAADNIISPTEKPAIRDEIARVNGDWAEITAGYEKYGLTISVTDTNAKNAYINKLETLLSLTEKDTFVKADYEEKQKAYYDVRTKCLINIANAAKAHADYVATLPDIGRNLCLASAIPFTGTDTLKQYQLSRRWKELSGIKITVSFDYEVNMNAGGDSRQRIGIETNFDGNYFGFWKNFGTNRVINERGRYHETRTVPVNKDNGILFYTYLQFVGSSGKATVKNIKIEVGDRMTKWTSAPEDLDSNIAAAQAQADASKARMDAWASDGYIAPTEKNGLREEGKRILTEFESFVKQAEIPKDKVDIKNLTAALTEYANVLTKYTKETPEYIKINPYASPSDNELENARLKYYTERTLFLQAVGTGTSTRFVNNERELSSVKGTVTANYSEFSLFKQTSAEFKTEVIQTQTDLQGQITENKTSIKQTSDNISLAVESISIGTENLYSADTPVETGGGDFVLSKSDNGFRIDCRGYQGSTYVTIKPKISAPSEYFISFDIYSIEPIDIDVICGYMSVSTGKMKSINIGHITRTGYSGEGHYGYLVDLSDDYNGGEVNFMFSPFCQIEVTFSNVMITNGNKEAPWVEAPEATRKRLLATGIDISNKTITVTADRFKIQDNSGRINSVFETTQQGPVLRSGYIDADTLVSKTLATGNEGNPRIEAAGAMMRVFGSKDSMPNIVFGVDEDGIATLSYYQNGKKLYDLGPKGIRMIQGPYMTPVTFSLITTAKKAVWKNVINKVQNPGDKKTYYRYSKGISEHDDIDGCVYKTNQMAGDIPSGSFIADGWYCSDFGVPMVGPVPPKGDGIQPVGGLNSNYPVYSRNIFYVSAGKESLPTRVYWNGSTPLTGTMSNESPATMSLPIPQEDKIEALERENQELKRRLDAIEQKLK